VNRVRVIPSSARATLDPQLKLMISDGRHSYQLKQFTDSEFNRIRLFRSTIQRIHMHTRTHAHTHTRVHNIRLILSQMPCIEGFQLKYLYVSIAFYCTSDMACITGSFDTSITTTFDMELNIATLLMLLSRCRSLDRSIIIDNDR